MRKRIAVILFAVAVIAVVASVLIVAALNGHKSTTQRSTSSSTTQQGVSGGSGPYITRTQASSLLGSGVNYTVTQYEGLSIATNFPPYARNSTSAWIASYRASSGAALTETLYNSTNAGTMYSVLYEYNAPNMTATGRSGSMEYAYGLKNSGGKNAQTLFLFGHEGDYMAVIQAYAAENSSALNVTAFVETAAADMS